jgi:hypothetical protein
MRKKRKFGGEVTKQTSGANEGGGSLLMKRKGTEGGADEELTKRSRAGRNAADRHHKKAADHAPPHECTLDSALLAQGSPASTGGGY